MIITTIISNIRYIGLVLMLFIFCEAKSQCPSKLDFEATGMLCVDGTVNFENISSSSVGGTFQFVVEGKTIAGPSYTHIFSSSGVKEITLVRTDPSGCKNEFKKSIEILQIPIADFSFSSDNSNPPCSNDLIQFTDMSTPDIGLSYLWDFGNGNTSNKKNPEIKLDAFGSGTSGINVKLIITNKGNCSSTIEKEVSVLQRPEIVLNDEFGFSINEFKNCENATPSTPGFEISFIDKSSPTVTNYRVDWGDGSSDYNGATAPTSHTYADLGVFEITYYATGTNGCIASKKYGVFNISNPSVGGGNPGNSVGCGPLTLTFPINGFENNHSSTTYQIDPGDGTGVHTLSHPPPDNFTHVYNTTSCGLPGNAFTFEIIAENGCKSTPFSTSAIEVYTPPAAAFELQSDSLCINQDAIFVNKTVKGFNSNCNSNTKYEWDFGDGAKEETLNDASVVHQYSNAGQYEVTLTSSNSCGTSSSTNTITICDTQPSPLFTMSIDGVTTTSTTECGENAVELVLPDGICPPLSLSVNNASSSGSCEDKYSWKVISESDGYEFQNGMISSDNENEIVTFSTGGSYIIQQTVTNACGSASSCIKVNLGAGPAQPKIEMDENYCEDDLITLMATFTGEADGFNWIVNGTNGTPDPTISEELEVLAPVPFTLPEGTYMATIEISNSCGKSSDSKTITVNGFPDAIISNQDSLEACQGQAVLLTANTGASFTYQWKLDSIDIPDSDRPTFDATKTGKYSVEVAQNGCSSLSNEIFVSFTKGPSPIISTNDETLLCYGIPINAKFDVNYEEGMDYQWFKDGNPIIDATDSIYTTTEIGEYHVEASASLCHVQSNLIKVSYLPEIVPGFDLDPKQCKGVEVSFINTTDVPTGIDLVYGWDFGDGSSQEAGTNATHVYDTVGVFDLTLTTSIDGNLCATQFSSQIEIVEPVETKFEMSIVPDDLCGPILVDFNNQSTGNYVTYDWDLGNGELSTLESPSQINFPAGILGDTSYVVSLQVNSEVSSCPSDVFSDTLTVRALPTAQFLFEKDEICADFPLQINNFSLGGPETFIWEFGDGSPSVSVGRDGTINHAFPYNGFSDTTYQVTLTSINQCGTDKLTKPVVVNAINVEAFYNLDKDQGCAPLEVNFTSNQVGFNSITWDWGDQPGNTSSGGLVKNHTYEQPGTYDVELLVQNGCNQDSFVQQITVFPSPEVDFTSDGKSCVDHEVIFENTSPQTVGSVWDFGKGDAPYAGAIPLPQSYASAGDYTVTLMIADPVNGCSNSLTKTIEVLPLPIADFSIGQDVCPGIELGITNNSIHANTYKWRFQEGGALIFGSDAVGPVYTAPGVYNITLIAENELKCSDSISQQINVQEAAKPDFEIVVISADENETPLEVTVNNFTQYPLYGNGTFNWILPDGRTFETFDIQEVLTLHNFSDTVQGQKITLTATTAQGCATTVAKTIRVQPTPCDERLTLPNVFTPNGDGLNDVLRSLVEQDMETYRQAVVEDNFIDYRMEVYSRWGEVIFRSKNVEEGWNGNGHSEDIYLVVVSFQCKFNDGGKFLPQEILLKH